MTYVLLQWHTSVVELDEMKNELEDIVA